MPKQMNRYVVGYRSKLSGVSSRPIDFQYDSIHASYSDADDHVRSMRTSSQGGRYFFEIFSEKEWDERYK